MSIKSAIDDISTELVNIICKNLARGIIDCMILTVPDQLKKFLYDYFDGKWMIYNKSNKIRNPAYYLYKCSYRRINDSFVLEIDYQDIEKNLINENNYIEIIIDLFYDLLYVGGYQYITVPFNDIKEFEKIGEKTILNKLKNQNFIELLNNCESNEDKIYLIDDFLSETSLEILKKFINKTSEYLNKNEI